MEDKNGNESYNEVCKTYMLNSSKKTLPSYIDHELIKFDFEDFRNDVGSIMWL